MFTPCGIVIWYRGQFLVKKPDAVIIGNTGAVSLRSGEESTVWPDESGDCTTQSTLMP